MTLAAGLLALIAALSTPAMEQRPLVLRHLTTADGLPQATVMTTLRDSQGFVWFGTEDGLVRFDGQKLVRYASLADDGNSLPGNFIWQVVEDSNHDLWIAVRNGGVARWRRATDRFDVFQHVDGQPDSLASNAVRTLLVDGQGRVWIGTSDAGVDVLDPRTGKARHLRHDDSGSSLSSNEVFTLLQDRSGDVWIGTKSGLDRWDHGVDRITRLGSGEPHTILRAQILQVLEASDASFWIGSFDAGLAHIDRDGHLLRHDLHEARNPDSLASDEVRALLQDPAGNLWVGTKDGLDLLQPGATRFAHYRRDPGDVTTLRDAFIRSLYQDPTGLIWIGTSGGGVSRWNPRSWEMGGARPQWLREQQVMGFADAGGSGVWIASVAGLYRHDGLTGVDTPFDQAIGRRGALGDQPVMSLQQDHEGSLWIGTMMQGLKRLRPDNSLQSFAVAPGKPRALSAAGIMSIAESHTGHIWVGTYDGGVNIVDPASGEVRQLPFGSAPGAVSGSRVTAMVETRAAISGWGRKVKASPSSMRMAGCCVPSATTAPGGAACPAMRSIRSASTRADACGSARMRAWCARRIHRLRPHSSSSSPCRWRERPPRRAGRMRASPPTA